MNEIYQLKRKTISITELKELLKPENYKEFVDKVNELIEKGILAEVKGSGINGMNPSLFNKYRVVESQEDYSEIKKEIMEDLPIDFSREYYLNNPSQYLEDRKYIERIKNFFQTRRQELLLPMANNERSFSLFGEEKFLKDGYGKTILKNLGLTVEQLNYYGTPEPFVYYSRTKDHDQNVLIIENKDTWYSIRKLMIEGQKVFLGKRMDTIIYGSGKNIQKAMEEYEETVESYLFNPNQIFYWGDIDYEGISIFERLKSKFSERFNISLFYEAYQKMVEESFHHVLPKTKEKQNRNIGDIFLNAMKPYDDRIRDILEKGIYIPQEIINYQLLKA